jgi:hypothetical protein
VPRNDDCFVPRNDWIASFLAMTDCSCLAMADCFVPRNDCCIARLRYCFGDRSASRHCEERRRSEEAIQVASFLVMTDCFVPRNDWIASCLAMTIASCLAMTDCLVPCNDDCFVPRNDGLLSALQWRMASYLAMTGKKQFFTSNHLV